MKHFPIIIIGAGPAGSTCARQLAKESIEVLLLEKERLPRLKSCGGGFSEKSYNLFDFDLADVIETMVQAVTITLQAKKEIIINRPEGMGYMVMRDKLDALLVDQAVALDATFHQEEECLSIEREKNRWIVRTDKDTYSADFLVGADGVPSKVARWLGLMEGFDRNAVALAAEIRVSDEQLERQGSAVHFDFHHVSKGYAWVFPKADHLSIGVYTALNKLKGLRKSLDEFINGHENLKNYKEMFFCKGHLVPRGGVYNCLVTEGALLAGDAAAMTDPFWGEGIYYSAKSGILAAAAIIRAIKEGHRRLDHYDDECRRTLVRDLWWTRFFNFCFYRFPRISYPIVYHRPYLQDLILDVNSGRISWRECVLRMTLLSPYWAFKR